MKRWNKKTLDKRREERKDFPEFYQRHIKHIKEGNIYCEECGERLLGDVSEIAHILNKSFFKSICTNDKNVVYLCSWKSSNNCHAKYDNCKNEDFHKMKIYKKTKKLFNELLSEITEKISYKIFDRYDG